tara:strand:+ start:297 stop:563 length:267 start_codon:yes stop_codon:yes gene_type:complete
MGFKLNKPNLKGSPKVCLNSMTGFKSGSNDEHNDINYIHSRVIDMTNVPYDIEGVDDLGYSKIMEANSGIHEFHPNATIVKEVKIKKI